MVTGLMALAGYIGHVGQLFDQADKVASVVGAVATIFGAWLAYHDRRSKRDPRHRVPEGSPLWRGMVVSGVGLVIILGVAASVQYRQDADGGPIDQPSVHVPTSPPAGSTPGPSDSQVAPQYAGRQLVVTAPRPGKVGFQEVAKVATPPLPARTTVLIMVRVIGGSWYPTKCLTDPVQRVSTCVYAQFGSDSRATGGSFEIAAIAVADRTAQELLDHQPYSGALGDLRPTLRSEVYEYSR